MTSMRKLRRRLLRWERYAAATGLPPMWGSPSLRRPPGHGRAVEAVAQEQFRREMAAYERVPYMVTERGLERVGLL